MNIKPYDEAEFELQDAVQDTVYALQEYEASHPASTRNTPHYTRLQQEYAAAYNAWCK